MNWVWTEADGTWSIQGQDVWIWMSARPRYCDRGNWLAHIDYRPQITVEARLKLSIDGQDGWPRYYFDLERAKAECEAWLQKRGQWVGESSGNRPTAAQAVE